MSSVIEKLRVKGAPAPRNSPTSPMMTTSRENRSIPNTILSLDKSYEIVLKHANKNSLEFAYLNSSAPSRRLEYLSRIQHANYGISTMDSPFCVSEDSVILDKPSFVLCGQPVSGINNKTLDKYLSDQRTGNYTTSAKEMHRVRTTKLGGKAKSEPSSKPREIRFSKDTTKSDLPDNVSMRSDCNTRTVPSSAISINSNKHTNEQSSSDKPPFELTGRGFKGRQVSADRFHAPKSDFMSYKSASSYTHKTRQESTECSVKSIGEEVGSLRTCLKVQSQKQPYTRPCTVDDYYPIASKQSAFSKNGVRLFNNPYRHMKHRENVLMRDRHVDMKTVRKVTNAPNFHIGNGKHFDFPRGILRVPNPCSDTFLLQMLLAVNSPKLHHQNSVTGKYSDIALQRDLDEYMVVRSPSSQGKPHSGIQRSPAIVRSAKSAKSKHNADEENTWAGNIINEDQM